MNDLFSSSRKNLKGSHVYSILISIIGWSFPFGVGLVNWMRRRLPISGA